MIQEEFAKYDIQILLPIRTIYSVNEKKETEEIGKVNQSRTKVHDDHGLGMPQWINKL